jgi:hypothetical protein
VCLNNFYIKFAEVINIALGLSGRDDLIITTNEKELIKEFEQFLSIFEMATKVLQGYKNPTLSLSILFLEQMKKMYVCNFYTNLRVDFL